MKYNGLKIGDPVVYKGQRGIVSRLVQCDDSLIEITTTTGRIQVDAVETEEVKKMKKGVIKLAGRNLKTDEVDGYIFNEFLSVHRSVGDATKWTLTHTPSGISMNQKIATKKQAEAYASAVMETGLSLDFTTQAEFSRFSRDDQRTLGKACGRFND